jgi:hypothetical protein
LAGRKLQVEQQQGEGILLVDERGQRGEGSCVGMVREVYKARNCPPGERAYIYCVYCIGLS